MSVLKEAYHRANLREQNETDGFAGLTYDQKRSLVYIVRDVLDERGVDPSDRQEVTDVVYDLAEDIPGLELTYDKNEEPNIGSIVENIVNLYFSAFEFDQQ